LLRPYEPICNKLPRMALQIRILTEADADTFVAIRRTALQDSPGAFLASPEDDSASSEAAARELLRRVPDSLVFGVYAPDLSGTLGLYRDGTRKAAHKAHLWGMFVLSAQRRCGLATHLLRTAIEHARALEGVTVVHLSVSDSAPAARRLYESAGFKTWGIEPDAIRVGPFSYSEHHMILTL
jgi:ribosomal protein S18 acetylase RimI-like enzyme